MDEKENINPNVFQKISEREITYEEEDDDIVDEFDAREIFGMFKEFMGYSTNLTSFYFRSNSWN